MELKVGMFVRTIFGEIGKIRVIKPNGLVFINNDQHYSEMYKFSNNITDLIEVGDYVNGMIVTEIKDNRIFTNDIEWNEIEDLETDDYGRICGYGFKKIPIEPIREILTKQQYEANCFKIGE